MPKYGDPKADFNEEKDRLLSLLNREENRDIILRLVGALAFNTKCKKFNYLQKDLGREFTDIDFASYRKQSSRVKQFLTDCGYKEDVEVNNLFGTSRLLFHDTINKRHVDVFLDELKFSHTINLRGRLEQDPITIPLAELFLEKMQIAKINEKDLIDTIMLLREYDFGETDNDEINKNIILNYLTKDWGFWKTVVDNLNILKNFLNKYPQLTDEDKSIVSKRIDYILEEIEKAPKSLKWKMRSKIGTKMKWYQEVDELGV